MCTVAILPSCVTFFALDPRRLPHSYIFLPTGHRYLHCLFHVYRAMMRNETVYPDAAAFRPERFMEPTTPEMERKMDPKQFVFGFGRR